MGAVDSDLAAIQAIGETLTGTGKPFVNDRRHPDARHGRDKPAAPGNEDDQSDGGPRVDAANYTIGWLTQGVRSSVVRLAPMVHSDLDHHGFTHALIGFARENRGAAYITGDGS